VKAWPKIIGTRSAARVFESKADIEATVLPGTSQTGKPWKNGGLTKKLGRKTVEFVDLRSV